MRDLKTRSFIFFLFLVLFFSLFRSLGWLCYGCLCGLLLFEEKGSWLLDWVCLVVLLLQLDLIIVNVVKESGFLVVASLGGN